MSLTLNTPVQSSRIEIIDVLRGFTLLGIIIIHMVEQYYAGMMPASVEEGTTKTIVDNVVEGFAGIFIMGKFFMIFSFLFGLSFYIQFAKSGNDRSFLWRFTWRLLILFAIGLLHHIHYRGDILTIYAVLGFGLLLCYKLSDRALLIIGLLLVLNIPSVIIRVGQGLFYPEQNLFGAQDQEPLLHYYNTVKSGSYLDILELNFYSLKEKVQFQVFSGRIFITFGLFLLGIYAGRKSLFEKVNSHLTFFKKTLNMSWKILAGAIVFAGVFFGGAHLLNIVLPNVVNFSVGGLLYDLFNACLAVIYVSAIVMLFQKEKWQKRLMNFYEVGRMGLTTYIMQSLFGVLIFFSYGLGLLSELGAAWSFVIAIVLFVVQIIFSKVWFRYFNYGFFEWVWRCLTLWRAQPLYKTRTLPIPVRSEV